MTLLRWIIAAVLAFLVLALSCLVIGWKGDTSDRYRLEAAKSLARSGHPEEALRLVNARRGSAACSNALASEWMAVHIESLVQLGDAVRLRELYYRSPDSFRDQERASLMVTRSLSMEGDKEAAASLREAWCGREINLGAWLVLDSDLLVRAGQREEALTLLESTTLAGTRDVGRLTRLALLNADRPLVAWRYLDDAYRIAPRDSAVRSFRGQLLEAAQKLPAARVEYVAAVMADPRDATRRDQLAEFYRRHGRLSHAVQTWKDAVATTSADYIELKLAFWGRVAHPHGFDWGGHSLSTGELRAMVSRVVALPKHRFWLSAAESSQDTLAPKATQREEIRWLRLLQHLANGNEQRALRQLEVWGDSPRSLNPQLKQCLCFVLAYRAEAGTPGAITSPPVHIKGQRHQFYRHLESLSQLDAESRQVEPADSLDAFLLSGNALSATLLAGGWPEAALYFYKEEEPTPTWLAYGIAQSLRMNRSTDEAISYLDRLPARDSVLDLLHAELLLGKNQHATAHALLLPIASAGHAAGRRAAWLLCSSHLLLRDAEAARRVLEGNKAFRQSTPGKELAARIALCQGNESQAERVYSLLGEDSMESVAYFMKQALVRNDFDEAERLNRKLIRKIPDNMQLRSNLITIQQQRVLHEG